MTSAEFEDLIDRHGGDPTLWPAELQVEAAALLQASPTARSALAAMQEVETFLVTSRAQPVDHGAFAARASQRLQVRPIHRFAIKTGWSAAAAALLAIGILIGRTSGISQDDDPSTILARTLASTEIINVE